MKKKSIGSKLGAISGVILMIAFFLPWLKACNQELTGYDIATNSTGQIEDSWVYWLVFISGVMCFLFLFLRTNRSGARIGAAFARLIVGLMGFLPVLNIWYNIKQRGAAMEILYGGWVVLSGYIGVALSFFVDLYVSANGSKSDDLIT